MLLKVKVTFLTKEGYVIFFFFFLNLSALLTLAYIIIDNFCPYSISHNLDVCFYGQLVVCTCFNLSLTYQGLRS